MKIFLETSLKGSLDPLKFFFSDLFHKCQMVVTDKRLITCDDGRQC